MRDAGFALRLVGRADLVPHHVGDDGSAVIGDHHHLHAVVEREGGDIDIERAGRACGGKHRTRTGAANRLSSVMWNPLCRRWEGSAGRMHAWLLVLEDVADVEDGAVVRVLRLLLGEVIGLQFRSEFGVGLLGAVRLVEGNAGLGIYVCRQPSCRG